MSMYVEQVAPELILGRSSLVERLFADAVEAGVLPEASAALVAILPPRLKEASCFLDKLTNLWRYEFGEPLYLEAEKQHLWGAQMWVPVRYLRRALLRFIRRVPDSKKQRFLERLDEREKHLEVLSEMIPLLSLNESVATDFEVVGRGYGNREIDWLVGPVGGREILFDVKSRFVDLIKQMDQSVEGNESPAPTHDATLMFKSVEPKFKAAEPYKCLQGVWIATHIKQEKSELEAAFLALDGAKVHFAVLAHWEPGGKILTRDPADRPFLAELFGINENDRFVFRRC